MSEGKVVVMIGNLSDGFTPVGPFDSWDEGAAWSDRYCHGQSWVMPVLTPEDALRDLREVYP